MRPRRSSLVMIAHISGKLLRVGGSHVVVDAAGVGYKVFVPVSTLMAMPQQGEPVSFHIHTIVKEDAIELYGFANELEQEAFELLISVSGVGPKMALALLSAMSVRELAAAARDDGGRLQTAPGIGRKTAQRIALEVGEKLQVLALAAAGEEHGQTDVLTDVIEGLLALGYPRADARRMAQDARKRLPDADSAAALIKEALSSVSQ